VGGCGAEIVGVLMFRGTGQTKSQDRFGGGGEECVDCVGNPVQVCLECEEVVSVEVVELGEVTVELLQNLLLHLLWDLW
jgi:hypothetical protein